MFLCVCSYMLPKGEHKIQGLTVLRDLSSYAFRSAKEENVQRQVLSFMDTDQSNGPAPGNIMSNQVIIGSKESTPSLAPLLPSSPPQQQLDMGRGHQGKSYLLRPTDSGNKFDGSDVSLIPATSSSILMNVTLTSASSAVEPSVLTGNFQTLMPVSSHVDTLQGSPWICFSDRPAASSSKKSSFDDVEQSAPAELDSVVKASWAPSSDRHQSQSSVLTPCSSVEEAIYIDTLIDCQAGLKPRDSVNANLLSTSTWDPCLRSLTLLRVDLPDTGSLSPTRELIQVSEIKD